MYLQYYCWKNPANCGEEFSDMLQCIIQKCSDCDDDEDEHHDDEEEENEDNAEMCTCIFDTCWEATEECFFDQNCWKLVFTEGSDEYGLDAMFESINVPESNLPPVPTLMDTRIRENYCNDKDCSEKFWNLWYCIWLPIYMGDAYYDSEYWHDVSTGCGVGNIVYEEFPECISQKCLGYADDCVGVETSQCSLTFQTAMEADELSLCEFCEGSSNPDCVAECITAAEFKTKYLTRCGNDGTDCPQDYRNLANCLYRECADQEEWLAGAEEPPEESTTRDAASGVIMQNGVLALILSAVLVALAL
jgi:hypothetical protein